MNNLGIPEKVSNALKTTEYDAVLITGPDNVKYLSGAIVPFNSARHDQYLLVFWPQKGDTVLICPEEWESSVRKTSWLSSIHTYSSHVDGSAAAVKAIASVVNSGHTSVLGTDFEGIPHGLYENVAAAVPQVEIVSCDSFLKVQRMTKTEREVEKLADIALRTDHAINGCIHHITVDRRMSELTFAEELRIHSVERDIDLVGYNACSRVASGKDLHKYWPCCPQFGYSMTKDLQANDIVRIELQNTLDGYWSNAARMMVMSRDMSDRQAKEYGYLVELRKMLLELLAPGTCCSDIFSSALSQAGDLGIPVVSELGMGHGIGVGPVEPPYLNSCDTTRIEVNMVLVLDPVVKTESGILRSKDTVVIKEDGAEIVNWYKNWREPYSPIMSI